MSKQYGLILPQNKSQKAVQSTKKPSIFDDDSDSNDEQPNRPTGLTKPIKTRDKLTQNRALEEDPTVFQYDEIYDEMDKKRKESKLARKDLDKKPKYISKLLQTAERRKRENELRIERQVQKERETDGDKFNDKETFVTNSYRKKLEELKKLEEIEEREEYLESIGDVRKQGNLDGFYRHLYEQKVKYEEGEEETEANKRNLEEGEEQENKQELSVEEKKQIIKAKRRKLEGDGDSSEDGEEEVVGKKQHLSCNLDADSDFSIDSSSEDDDTKGNEDEKTNQPKIEKESTTTTEKSEETENVAKPVKEEPKTSAEIHKTTIKVEEETKPKIDIWKKRTIGDVFEAARQRYFERRSLREL